MHQLRSAFFILSVFKVWWHLVENYEPVPDFNFAKTVGEFEISRAENSDEYPWINFTAALSNAGFSQNRIVIRHDILCYFLNAFPSLNSKKRDKRFF